MDRRAAGKQQTVRAGQEVNEGAGGAIPGVEHAGDLELDDAVGAVAEVVEDKFQVILSAVAAGPGRGGPATRWKGVRAQKFLPGRRGRRSPGGPRGTPGRAPPPQNPPPPPRGGGKPAPPPPPPARGPPPPAPPSPPRLTPP